MVKRKDVLCGDNYPQELEINIDTVYRRYNIRPYTDQEGKDGYIYDEDELTLLEYLRETVPNNEKALGEISILLANLLGGK